MSDNNPEMPETRQERIERLRAEEGRERQTPRAFQDPTKADLGEELRVRIIEISVLVLWVAGFLYELPVFVRNLAGTEANPDGFPELLIVVIAFFLWPFVLLNDISRWIIHLVT